MRMNEPDAFSLPKARLAMTEDKHPKTKSRSASETGAAESEVPDQEALEVDAQDSEAEAPKDHLHITEVYRHNLARNMKRLRKQLKLTQVGLAERIGVGQAQIALLEVSKVDASLKSLTRIARGLGTNPMELLSPPPGSDLVRLPWTEQSQSMQGAAEFPNQGPQRESEVASLPDVASSPAHKSAEDRTAGKEHEELSPQPETVLNSLGQALNLTTAKHIAGAVHKRLEAMERRHGSAPMTRSMLNALLVTMLNASQALDYENENETSEHP